MNNLFAISIAVMLILGSTDSRIQFLCANTIQDDATAEKQAPPSKSQVREKTLVIRGIFADQYKDRTLEGKSRLADELLDTARQSNDDAAGQYVLLSEALGVAIESANTSAACQSSELLIQLFDVDASKLRGKLIDGLSKSIQDPDDWDQLKSHINPMVAAAIDANEYKTAEQLIQSINRAARRINDMLLVETTGRKLKSLKNMAREYSGTKSHRLTLDQDPDDAAANQAMGEFRCFWKRNFKLGLPNLAKGDDKITRELAMDELTGFSDNLARIQIADRWWALARKRRGEQSDAAASHAIELYKASLEEAQGIEKKRMESRIAQHNSAQLAGLTASIKGIFGKPWRVTWQNGQVPWERTVFASNGTMQSFAQNRNWNNTFVIENNVIRILNQTKEFIFTVEFYGNSLVCRKFDVKTGQLLDRGNGVLLKE